MIYDCLMIYKPELKKPKENKFSVKLTEMIQK